MATTNPNPQNPRITYQDMLNPLFLHPSYGATSVQVDKLEGSTDYRAWKRSMEISLSSKRKLGFVKGTVPLPADDPVKAEMWETCDNMVISWITSNLSPTIRKSVIYMSTSREIWNNLEQRFSLTNGSRKYKLNKDLYDIKQDNLSVNAYYTAMRTVWEELDALNCLPSLTATSDEITKLLGEIQLQKEESKLFQFLNGLNDVYAPQRSQLLLMNPLPKVEHASAVLQQEEAQRDLLSTTKATESEMLAMYSKVPNKTFHCTKCGGKSHTADRCWSVVGYPRWHSNYTGPNPQPRPPRTHFNSSQAPRPRWPANNRTHNPRTANSVQAIDANPETQLAFTPQQLSQLAQLMQLSSVTQNPQDSDLPDTLFSGMMSNNAITQSTDWIIDSGASHHMTPYLATLESPTTVINTPHINLPTGATANITHSGNITLSNGLHLHDVLCIFCRS